MFGQVLLKIKVSDFVSIISAVVVTSVRTGTEHFVGRWRELRPCWHAVL